MLREKRWLSRLAVLGCLSAGVCVALVGCGKKAIPGLVPVSGQVNFKGQPFTKAIARPGGVAGPNVNPSTKGKWKDPNQKTLTSETYGTVVFFPDMDKGNKSPHQPAGTIDAEGKFRMITVRYPGALPGHYLVSVQSVYGGPGAPPKSAIPMRYADVKTSKLTVEVRADAPAGHYDLNLVP